MMKTKKDRNNKTIVTELNNPSHTKIKIKNLSKDFNDCYYRYEDSKNDFEYKQYISDKTNDLIKDINKFKMIEGII